MDNYKKFKLTLYDLDKKNMIGAGYIYLDDIKRNKRSYNELSIDENIVIIFEAQVIRNKKEMLEGILDLNREYIYEHENEILLYKEMINNINNLFEKKEKKFNDEKNFNFIDSNTPVSKDVFFNNKIKEININNNNPIYLNYSNNNNETKKENVKIFGKQTFFDYIYYIIISIFFLSLLISVFKNNFLTFFVTILFYYLKENKDIFKNEYILLFNSVLIFDIIWNIIWTFRIGVKLWNSNYIDYSYLYIFRDLFIILNFIVIFLEIFTICLFILIWIMRKK